MIPQIRPPRGPALALAVSLIALAVGFRLLRAAWLPDLPNFSPVMALAICGGLFLPRTLAVLVPLSALILTDVLLDLHYGVAPFSAATFLGYACYGLGVASGQALRRLEAGRPATFALVVANSLLFYGVTNSLCWLDNPAYAKTAAGWLQALTVGVPGFPPTWTFLGYSLASDLAFTAVFLAAIPLATRPETAPVAARA